MYKFEYGEWAQSVIDAAGRYNIPFNESSPNLHQLMREIEDYEELLIKAHAANLDIDLDYYDPLGLTQALDELEICDSEDRRDAAASYAAMIGA